MNDYRRLQNIRLPEAMRDRPQRTSVSRTIRNIRPTDNPRFREIGAAMVFEREVIVGTASGKFWVIVEVQGNVKSEN